MNLLLSGVWTGQNPSGWWLSEKFDGFRVCWDGATLRTRGGNAIAAPAAWLAELPTGIALDGELWHGRGNYNQTDRAVKAPTSANFAGCTFRVFDAPDHPGTFEERQSYLAGLSLAFPVALVPQSVCRGPAHLKRCLREIFSLGGEGLMLRQARSTYVRDRSDTLLKVRCVNNSELLHD